MGLAGVLEVDLAIPSAVCAGHSDHPQATFWSAQDWRRRTSPPARSGAQRSAYQIVELSVGDARGVCRPELDGLLSAANPVCRRPVGQHRFGVRAHRHDQPMRAIKYRPVLAVHLVAVAATARRRAPPAGRPGGQDGYGRGQALIGRALYLRLGVKQSFVVRGVLLAGGGSPTSGWARLAGPADSAPYSGPVPVSASGRRPGLNSAPRRQCRDHCDDGCDQTDQGRILRLCELPPGESDTQGQRG